MRSEQQARETNGRLQRNAPVQWSPVLALANASLRRRMFRCTRIIDAIFVCGCSFTYSQYVPEKPQVLQSIPADDPTHEHRHGHMRYGEQAPLTLHSLLRLRTNHRCNRPRLFTPSPDTMTRRAHGTLQVQNQKSFAGVASLQIFCYCCCRWHRSSALRRG